MPFNISKIKNGIKLKNNNINFYSENDPNKLPWKSLKVDVVLECSGAFHFQRKGHGSYECWSKKVIISAPGTNVDKTIVQGVNNHELLKKHNIISNGSCTTNCLAPLAMILDKGFGIDSQDL